MSVWAGKGRERVGGEGARRGSALETRRVGYRTTPVATPPVPPPPRGGREATGEGGRKRGAGAGAARGPVASAKEALRPASAVAV